MNLFKKALRRIGLDVRRVASKSSPKLVELPATIQPARGAVLVAFVVEPFLLRKGEEIPSGHTHFVEATLMAKVFLEMGFSVDVVDYNSTDFVPTKQYDILVSSRKCLQRHAERLGPTCLKIVHVTVSHWLHNNAAATARCLALKQRRGCSLGSYKLIEENNAIEHADFAMYRTGNAFVPETYAYAGRPFARIPLCTHTVYPAPETKPFDEVRRSFLWLGSHGFVHKGLDLTLEAFAQLPDFNLFVCGPIDDEPAFKKAFDRELYRLPNIKTIGWVDITGERFREIVGKCVGLVYPSCAEGAAGNVLTCMQAGLIPVISYESCVDMSSGNGIQIPALSVDAVRESVMRVAEMPVKDLHAMAMRAWDFARENHTHERYMIEYRKAVEAAMDSKQKRRGNPPGIGETVQMIASESV